jgi:hypothetical protein
MGRLKEEGRMTEEEELAELQTKAEKGDRDAVRELRMRKLTGYAASVLDGALEPVHDGRVAHGGESDD